MTNQIFTERKCLSEQEIDSYLNAKLSDAARFEIENHLVDCRLCNDAIQGFSIAAKSSLSSPILEELKENFTSPPIIADDIPVARIRSNKFQWFALAAAIALTILALNVFWTQDRDLRLYKKYYSSYVPESISGTRTVGPTIRPEYEQAVTPYLKDQFSESAIRLNAYVRKYPDDFKAHYLLGMSYLETEEFDLAVIHFTLARFNSELYYEDATWYLALAYLAQNKGGFALDLLDQLHPKVSPQYKNRVNALREELRSGSGNSE